MLAKISWKPRPGGQYGTCCDISIVQDIGRFRMWLSWRPKKSVALSESSDGIHWSAPQIVLPPNPATGWEDEINRPAVARRADGYHMRYTGQNWNPTSSREGRQDGHSSIGYSTSSDGLNWTRRSSRPVLTPQLRWEDVAALMGPDVLWDEKNKQWRMWYSAGALYEPDAIGHATSKDGMNWVKDPVNPVFRPDPRYDWERQRVAGIQMIVHGDWFYAFYIGYRDIDHAQIGVARSGDGLHDWERCPLQSHHPRGRRRIRRRCLLQTLCDLLGRQMDALVQREECSS